MGRANGVDWEQLHRQVLDEVASGLADGRFRRRPANAEDIGWFEELGHVAPPARHSRARGRAA